MNQNFRRGPALLLTLLLAGCVTINIYFPAAAATKVADKIIDEVWQTPSSAQAPAPAPAPANAPVPASTTKPTEAK
jgi:ribosomal protein L12E/L44/L45/RPP1/RPP2